MINISLNKIGKKFNREWIFRDLCYEIKAGEKMVILGGNGSGKSTLLQVISGFVTPNSGTILYEDRSSAVTRISSDEIRNYISFASPYIQLVEDFTAPELLEHLAPYKPFYKHLDSASILQICQLTASRDKFIRQYSSGMKQRLKLGLAFLANTPLLLLDEPLSNLDRKAIDWYKEMVKNYTSDRTVLVCSNAISEEFFFCDRELDIMKYKLATST